MNSWDLRNFRNDLSAFIKLIEDKGVTGDFRTLKTLVDDLDTKDLVHYKCEDILFYIEGRIPGTLPQDLNYCQIYLENMLMVKDNLVANLDPLHGFYMNIDINVYKSKTSTTQAYSSSWHLDRHLNKGVTKYTHPSYHFQFGGKRMQLIDPEMSVLSCPRIPHPPMDIFLGFHFILSNFFNNQQFAFVNDLLSDVNYQQIIKRAQARLWTPYFGAFDSTNTHTDFTFAKVFPLYT
jgi:hypothetical protein